MSDADKVNRFIRQFTRHEARVHAFIFSLVGDWDAAEEIAAETHAILWRKFDAYEEGTSFFAWACAVGRLEVMRYRRERGRNAMHFSDAFLDAIADESLAMGDELADRQRALANCMRKLNARDRDLIERRYLAGSTTKRVAEQVKRSTDAVYKALSRIRRTLHDCIERALGDGGTR